ncbi:hypothetical protein PIROE2DRAFT_7464 [Piromyces sp. E2]|nr:hypothetical protein PIROE2DRAFT_7464 [Piromyces sp. E2]|eukprot:OUM65532.1 hypothetical protein PIROE2DRAFT_7464 [Piromyces sp. E2]
MSNSDIEILIPIVHDLVSLSNVLPHEKARYVMSICFNILTRAALTGNMDAMYNLISASFEPTKEEVVKILNIEGIEDLNYRKIKEELSQKLEENESESIFIEIIYKMK